MKTNAEEKRPVTKRAYSVAEFCEGYGISKTMLYALWSKGQGPNRMDLGERTLISVQAAEAWEARFSRAPTVRPTRHTPTRPAPSAVAKPL